MSEGGKRYRVFVVDDEPVIASSLAMILRQSGFDAIAFTLPLEALRAARSEHPDLLISDVAMPLLSGIELATQVQGNCPDCKVLLFSGQPATVSMLKSALANGQDYEVLEKPVHPVELLNKIRGDLGFEF